MNEGAVLSLVHWQNFYVIVGAAAGSLTGLQFVVMTLLAQVRATSSMREIRAFGTPTVMHFCTALLVSALMCVPWQSTVPLAAWLGAGGVAGVIYSVSTFWHARKSSYEPDGEDWIWYAGIPLLAHTGLLTAAVMSWFGFEWSTGVIAVVSLTLLLVGIHNSWDTVTYVAVKHTRKDAGNE